MTIAEERYEAVWKARDFIQSLMDPKATPKVPREIRKEAYWRLRHFPSPFDMEETRKKVPEIWGYCQKDETLCVVVYYPEYDTLSAIPKNIWDGEARQVLLGKYVVYIGEL